jgi:hypothetical protein
MFFLVILSTILISCNNNRLESEQNLNYSNSFYWASSPSSIEKDVDVFFVYPTLFGGIDKMNMDITDDNMRKLVQTVLLKQASVFKDNCNIYAPYYRQMALDGLAMNEEEKNKCFSIGLADIEQAFNYYINNLNNGRPFILAGHSQGSEVLIELMKHKFEKPELMNKLIAAYIIGYSVTDNDLAQCEWLKIAESADDIGVIITYNTQSEFATGSPVLLPNAKCVNPLNWQTTSEYAPKEMNLGAVFFKENGEIDSIAYQFTDAWIDKNSALVTGTPNINIYSSSIFPAGVYHCYDYSFFFNNLKENVDVRINAYLDKN